MNAVVPPQVKNAFNRGKKFSLRHVHVDFVAFSCILNGVLPNSLQDLVTCIPQCSYHHNLKSNTVENAKVDFLIDIRKLCFVS